MKAKTLMAQGTGSSVGKSILVCALCRIFRQDGFKVAPFKSQNMALNSFVTKEGGEMGRAQVVQAEAAGIEPSVDMNPVLIKPEADARSQVVVLGKPAMTITAKEYYRHAPRLWKVVKESLSRLLASYDIVVIEGAGSPAEINLRRFEIVNMRVAKLAKAPVLLVGDIDKGGVFASLIGTLELLEGEERERIKGFIINKFRGDLSILQPGLKELERRTGKPVLGVVPYYREILIDEEDSIYEMAKKPEGNFLDVAVVYLPHISNSTDFEPLQREEGVRVRYVDSKPKLGTPDLIIIPGTKSTIGDLQHLRRTGLAEAIVEKVRAGTPVIGICGGYQILGKAILDPQHVESREEQVLGLGLLPVITAFEPRKVTFQVQARVTFGKGLLEGLEGRGFSGYEIHVGRSINERPPSPFMVVGRLDGKAGYLDGAIDPEGNILGTYIHGLFDDLGFRRPFLDNLCRRQGFPLSPKSAVPTKKERYDRLAEIVRQSLDMELFYEICGLKRP